MIDSKAPYKSHQSQWEQAASVRTKPKIVLTKDEKGPWYPIEKQPICIHSLIQDLGQEAIEFILIQSAYRFMQGIAEIETVVVNRIAMAIANNDFHIPFTQQHSLDALTVIIDETYHAYVANDFILQLEHVSGVPPLPATNQTSLTKAVDRFANELNTPAKSSFELIAVCLAENSITNALGGLLNDVEIHPGFLQVTRDHLADEGRHSVFFTNVLSYYWQHVSTPIRQEIAHILPYFIHDYLIDEEQWQYNIRILEALGLNASQIEIVLTESCIDYKDTSLLHFNPMLKPILHVLRKTQVLSDPIILSKLEDHGIIANEKI